MIKIMAKVTIAITLCATISKGASFQDYEYKPLDEVVRGKDVPSQVMSVSFHASLDPKVVHNHKIKMRWSKIRHLDGFDPANPNLTIKEPEDMRKRPTLCYTFVLRLANFLFTSLASHLPLEEARRVMDWKNGEAMYDMIS